MYKEKKKFFQSEGPTEVSQWLAWAVNASPGAQHPGLRSLGPCGYWTVFAPRPTLLADTPLPVLRSQGFPFLAPSWMTSCSPFGKPQLIGRFSKKCSQTLSTPHLPGQWTPWAPSVTLPPVIGGGWRFFLCSPELPVISWLLLLLTRCLMRCL